MQSRLRAPLALAVAACLVPGAIGPASAQSGLSGDERWIVLASRQDPAEAIALARAYRERFEATHVVTSSNGWNAVVAGPVPASDPGALQARLRAEPGLPDDLFVSDGTRFAEPYWTADAPRLERLRFDGDAPLAFEADGLTFLLDAARDDTDLAYPTIDAYEGRRVAFSIAFEDAASFSAGARLTIAPLDPEAPGERQIVTSAFTGGAHCCAVTRIAGRLGARWLVIPGATLDGDTGYGVRDLDGDGVYELVGIDQSFLYAYASYAASFAPIVIERYAGKKIVDLSDDPRFRRAFEDDLAWMDEAVRDEPALWRENGFLAAWAASMARLGRWEEARARVLASFDRSSDWPLTICEAPATADGTCPAGAERPAAFPDVLERHLRERGYIGG
ncbi:hypothetical protein [Salinarimonas rosea]|uniref:hypothetical protein n=1 Tax=Salinarimonas rosea TaxID=552063 RepID=UPI000415C309|nr:hypothetical protein [Salinarimonas rosea]